MRTLSEQRLLPLLSRGISRQREHSTIEIYTPQEMAALLLAATGNTLLSIALRGFAGPF
jgi:hypothetical protein